MTLAELAMVLAIIGLASAIGISQVRLYLDRIATRDAVRLAGRLVSRARDDAFALHTLVSIRVDTATGSLELLAPGMPVARAALGAVHAVSISTSRDSITFDARGLGYGSSNLTLVATRGRAADTLVVSRLGRVRY
jgi:Tfp pilus assembly protein FimT